jgi:hypothetical protein
MVVFSVIAQIIILAILIYINKYKQKVETEGEGYGIWDYFLRKPTLKKILAFFIFISVASLWEEIVFRYFLFQLIYLGFTTINFVVLMVLIFLVCPFFIAMSSIFIAVYTKKMKETDDNKELVLFHKRKNDHVFVLVLATISIPFLLAFYFISNIDLYMIVVVLYALTISSLAFGYAHSVNGFFGYVINSSLAGFFFGLFFYRHGLLAVWLLHLFWNFIVVVEYYITIKMREFG